METSINPKERAEEHPAYFLAGHPAPTGTYREMQTGREIRLGEEGNLPATCNGHVAVYIRQPITWAEIVGNQER